MIYPLTFHVTNWPLKTWMAGAAFGPFIFIRKGYEADIGLYQHELTHVKQSTVFAVIGTIAGLVASTYLPYLYWPMLWGALMGYMVNGLAYLLIRRFRLFAEAQAYAAQMRYLDRKGNYLTLGTAAYRLALSAYDLRITVVKARAILLNY